MHHWREKEHIFFHLLKNLLLVCCNFFFPLSDLSILCHNRYDWNKVLERGGRRKIQGRETIKQRVSRGTAVWERAITDACRVISVSICKIGLTACRVPSHTETNTLPHSALGSLCPQISCKLPLRKRVLWNGLRHNEDFSSSKLFKRSLNLGDEHTDTDWHKVGNFSMMAKTWYS